MTHPYALIQLLVHMFILAEPLRASVSIIGLDTSYEVVDLPSSCDFLYQLILIIQKFVVTL